MSNLACEKMLQKSYSEKCVRHAQALCELHNDTPIAVMKSCYNSKPTVIFYFGYNDITYEYYYNCGNTEVQNAVAAELAKHFSIAVVEDNTH